MDLSLWSYRFVGIIQVRNLGGLGAAHLGSNRLNYLSNGYANI